LGALTLADGQLVGTETAAQGLIATCGLVALSSAAKLRMATIEMTTVFKYWVPMT
jgi:hypothetical protein